MADHPDFQKEVSRGARFEFGKNWKRFLRVLTEQRIELAERSLKTMLRVDGLDRKSFLDVGCGSGLFSLAARRCGARVHSFDYDPESVACTLELKRRYFASDSNWTIERGSILDHGYLDRLGTFDVVYSWGVLHHTGQMCQALENIKRLARIGGYLFIAIYNDLGEVTNRWARIKQTYNSLPKPIAMLYALRVIASEERESLICHLRQGRIDGWVKSWTEYSIQSTRGMSKWHDWIDWIGGQPYERATIEEIVERFAKDGFRLTNLVDRSNGYGCNEFVFSRDAPLGTLIDVPIPGGSSLVRRYGRRVMGPFEWTEVGWISRLSISRTIPEGFSRLLFRNGDLIGPIGDHGANAVVVGPDESRAAIEAAIFHVVVGSLRRPQNAFEHVRGNMWSWQLGDLEHEADDPENPNRSSLFVFEQGRQLPMPHSVHNDIAQIGKGRFSHWGRNLYFSPMSVTEPNANQGSYALVLPSELTSDCVAT